MPAASVPKPGPAKLSLKASLPEWPVEAKKQCHYLPGVWVILGRLCCIWMCQFKVNIKEKYWLK